MINEVTISEEVILNKIYVVREQKVMLDSDLASLYQVETKQLKRQVKRNIDRFPEDFMFELTQEEYESLRRQFGTLKQGALEVFAYGFHRTRCSYAIKCVS